MPAGKDAATEGIAHQVVVRLGNRMSVQKGEVVKLAVDPDKVHVFDTDTGARLS